MEYVYASLLLHAAKQKIDENNLTKVLQSAGIQPDTTRVKALIAALEGIDIEAAIAKAAMPTAPVEAKAEKKEEKKEEEVEKKAELATEGLSSLFG